MSHIEAQEAEAGIGSNMPDHAPPAGGRAQMLREFWYYFSVNRGAVAGLFVFLLIVLLAILAPVLAPHDPVPSDDNRLTLPLTL